MEIMNDVYKEDDFNEIFELLKNISLFCSLQTMVSSEMGIDAVFSAWSSGVVKLLRPVSLYLFPSSPHVDSIIDSGALA